jgi:hypothetical protein
MGHARGKTISLKQADKQDHYLLQIVKKYASRNKPLPGVRETSSSSKGYQGTSAVPLYKEDRGRLLTQYARPWLKALHDQDADLYVDPPLAIFSNSRP